MRQSASWHGGTGRCRGRPRSSRCRFFALRSRSSARRLSAHVFWFLDRIQPSLLAGQREHRRERLGRLLPIRTVWCAISGPHAAGLGLVLQAHLVCRVHLLPAGVQQVLDQGLHPCHAPGDGLLVAVLVQRVGPFGSCRRTAGRQILKSDRYATSNRIFTTSHRWDVPELGVDTRLGGGWARRP